MNSLLEGSSICDIPKLTLRTVYSMAVLHSCMQQTHQHRNTVLVKGGKEFVDELTTICAIIIVHEQLATTICAVIIILQQVAACAARQVPSESLQGGCY